MATLPMIIEHRSHAEPGWRSGRAGADPSVERSLQYARSGALKTALLLAALAGLAMLVGLVLLGAAGAVLALGAVGVVAALGLRAPPAWIMRLQGAVPVAPWQAPELHHLVRLLAERAAIRPPQLYVIPSLAANAMTTGGGRERGALAVTEGALRLLDRDELEAVLAHEVAHLRARDTWIHQAAGLVSSSVTALLEVAIWLTALGAFWGGVPAGQLVLLIGMAVSIPWAVRLLSAALSRTRELEADRVAAALTGRPLALARALRKLSRQGRGWWGRWLRRTPEPPLLRSHPPTEDRIRRLAELAHDPAARPGSWTARPVRQGLAGLSW